MEKILLFQSDQQQQIAQIASRMNIRLVVVTPKQYAQTLEEMEKEQPPKDGAEKMPLPGSLLLFCGFSEKRLDKMLFELRSAKITTTHKAVLTPTNAKWTVQRLWMELERERMSMEGRI
jgi:hypothetical protein